MNPEVKIISKKLSSDTKYSFWQMWKWKIWLFEMALAMELIIVPYFWSSLYEQWILDNPERPSLVFLSLCMDHTIPLTTLIVEYIFISSTPFVPRHFWICAGLALLYFFSRFKGKITLGF